MNAPNKAISTSNKSSNSNGRKISDQDQDIRSLEQNQMPGQGQSPQRRTNPAHFIEDYTLQGSTPSKRVKKSNEESEEEGSNIQSEDKFDVYKLLREFDALRTNLTSHTTLDLNGNLIHRTPLEGDSRLFPASRFTLSEKEMLQYKQYILESSELPTRIFDPVSNKITTLDPKIVSEEKKRFSSSKEDSNRDFKDENKKADDLEDKYQPLLIDQKHTKVTKRTLGPSDISHLVMQDEYSPDEGDFEIKESESFQYDECADESEDFEGVDEIINFSQDNNSGNELIEVPQENDEIMSQHTACSNDILYSDDNKLIPRDIWDKESPFSDLQDTELLCKNDSCKICTK